MRKLPGRRSLQDWFAYIRTFEYLQATPELLTPDNLKSAIKRACRYEPDATSTYEEYVAPRLMLSCINGTAKLADFRALDST
jgi:transposase